jgi:hypothetical protein
LISETNFRGPNVCDVVLPFAPAYPDVVVLEFNPVSRFMTVSWNGQTVLQHSLPVLVTSRSQIHFGTDPSQGNPAIFSGSIRLIPPLYFQAAIK